MKRLVFRAMVELSYVLPYSSFLIPLLSNPLPFSARLGLAWGETSVKKYPLAVPVLRAVRHRGEISLLVPSCPPVPRVAPEGVRGAQLLPLVDGKIYPPSFVGEGLFYRNRRRIA